MTHIDGSMTEKETVNIKVEIQKIVNHSRYSENTIKSLVVVRIINLKIRNKTFNETNSITSIALYINQRQSG